MAPEFGSSPLAIAGGDAFGVFASPSFTYFLPSKGVGYTFLHLLPSFQLSLSLSDRVRERHARVREGVRKGGVKYGEANTP